MAENILNVATLTNQKIILELVENIQYKMSKRYTVKIDKNNSNPYNRIEYVDDAEGMIPAHMNYTNGVFDYGSWKDVWFVKNNYPVMLKRDGTVDYKLDPNDYTKKEDGSASDIANLNYNGNAMSRFPKVYLSFTEDTNYEYISVSNIKYDENYEPIGFINDNGDEVDEVFLSIYEGNKYNNMLRSISNQPPRGLETIVNGISMAKANGTGWHIRTWAQRQMVNALLTIISKSDDSQGTFGNGNSYNWDSEHPDTDYTLNNGALNDKGQFFGYNDMTHAVKVFHMENWWGNKWEVVDGIVAYQGKVYTKMSGPYTTPGQTTVSGYTEVLTFSADIGDKLFDKYAVGCKCNNKCGRLPISVTTNSGNEGSSTTYLCSTLYIKYDANSGIDYYFYPMTSGEYLDKYDNGAHYLSLGRTTSVAGSGVGFALSYMPQS